VTTPDDTADDKPGPGYMPPPTRAQITALEEDNDRLLNGLAQQYGVQFDGSSILKVRVDHLIDMLFGDDLDDERRRAFDASLAVRYRREIEQAGSTVRQQVLQAGRPGGGSGLIVPAAGPPPRVPRRR
jgi:hypothetical protein